MHRLHVAEGAQSMLPPLCPLLLPRHHRHRGLSGGCHHSSTCLGTRGPRVSSRHRRRSAGFAVTVGCGVTSSISRLRLAPRAPSSCYRLPRTVPVEPRPPVALCLSSCGTGTRYNARWATRCCQRALPFCQCTRKKQKAAMCGGVVVAVAVCVAASVSRQTKKWPPSVVLLQIWIMMPSTF